MASDRRRLTCGARFFAAYAPLLSFLAMLTAGMAADAESFALLVIDMQNAFAANKSAAMIARVNETIELFRSYSNTGRAHVFYTQHGYINGTTCDGHREYQRHWAARNDPKDCETTIRGQHGWEFVPGIAAPRANEPVVQKEVYDAFFQSALGSMLAERGVRTVVISGWETNVCCDSTARSAFFYGHRVLFLRDATATSSGDAVQRATLTNMQLIVADVIDVQQLRLRLQRALGDQNT